MLWSATIAAQSAVSARTHVGSRIQRRFACPRAIPDSWTAGDSTLGAKPRCALVVAAVAAINRAAPLTPALQTITLEHVACVRVDRITLRNPDRERIVSDTWLVEFYSDDQADVAVSLNPVTGTGRAFINQREFNASSRELCAQLPNDR